MGHNGLIGHLLMGRVEDELSLVISTKILTIAVLESF
jgi:hypothetical protein